MMVKKDLFSRSFKNGEAGDSDVESEENYVNPSDLPE